MDVSIERVRTHYEEFWPSRSQREFAWDLGPIEERVPGFRVLRIEPATKLDSWVYATVGASSVETEMPLEFVLLARTESPRHVETLAMVASFHADPEHRLAVGHVVNIGRPWAEGSTADRLVVSLPYPFGPDLECLVVGVRHVQVVWLVPITQHEAQFVADEGFAALEELLEQSGIDVLDPRRRSLA